MPNKTLRVRGQNIVKCINIEPKHWTRRSIWTSRFGSFPSLSETPPSARSSSPSSTPSSTFSRFVRSPSTNAGWLNNTWLEFSGPFFCSHPVLLSTYFSVWGWVNHAIWLSLAARVLSGSRNHFQNILKKIHERPMIRTVVFQFRDHTISDLKSDLTMRGLYCIILPSYLKSQISFFTFWRRLSWPPFVFAAPEFRYLSDHSNDVEPLHCSKKKIKFSICKPFF